MEIFAPNSHRVIWQENAWSMHTHARTHYMHARTRHRKGDCLSSSGFENDREDIVDFGFEDSGSFDSNFHHAPFRRQQWQHLEVARDSQQRHVQFHLRQAAADARPNTVAKRNPCETMFLKKWINESWCKTERHGQTEPMRNYVPHSRKSGMWSAVPDAPQ